MNKPLDTQEQKGPAARPRGRPRRLDLDRIVDAALEMGLSDLEMDAIAHKLGVGVGTLYGYVASRGELIELATRRMLERPLIADTGQSWQQVIEELAQTSFQAFTRERALLAELTKGGYETFVGKAFFMAMIDLLESRGFSRPVASDLYHEVGQVVLGAAVGSLNQSAHDESEPRSPIIGNYAPTLEKIIAAYEAIVP